MRLLDLFCGAGGAAMGYSRAGFDEIVGVDIVPQLNYPFRFVQADALNPPVRLEDFDLIHASPPCQAHSTLRHSPGARIYPDLIPATRDLLTGHAYIIENVVGAELRNPLQLCGSSMGLRLEDGFEVRRHRLFETSFAVMAPGCVHGGRTLGVYGDLSNHRRLNHASRRPTGDQKASKTEARALMGIDWMDDAELVEAIPPIFTEYLGRQFLDGRLA